MGFSSMVEVVAVLSHTMTKALHDHDTDQMWIKLSRPVYTC